MRYDAIVVGGGLMGVSTAYALLRRGLKRVVVLEKHQVGHDLAASTDNTKAIRYEYGEDVQYSQMVGRAIEMWQALEAETSTELYVNCGLVNWGRGALSYAQRSYQTLAPLGIPIREVSPEELGRLYPQFNVTAVDYATVNPEGGFLRASSCVAALAMEIRRLGGEIRENTAFVDVDEAGDGVRVRLDSGEQLEADRVVIAAGAWGAKLLPELGVHVPLTANRQQVVYMSGLGAEFAPGPFPVFLNIDHEFYGFPLDAQGLQKSSIHLPGEVIDPDIPLQVDPDFTQHILDLLATYIPGAARGQVALARTCMYAMTPDEDFIIDKLPGHRNVSVLAGFSGHGFKFGPVIGELAAALALGEEPEFALEKFAINRFS